MSENNSIAQVAQVEIIPANSSPDIETMKRADVPAVWTSFRDQLTQLKASVDSVLAADPELPTSSKLARVTRLDLRKLRIEVENKRKELGEYHLRRKQAVDSEAKAIKDAIEPYEDKLLEIEQYAERKEKERLDNLERERSEKYFPYFSPGQIPPQFRDMTDEQFETALSDAKTLHEAKLAAARKAEEERIAREKAEAEERERIRLENERLRKEAQERERLLIQEREKAAAEKRAIEEKARKEREKAAATARAEREKAEAQAAKEREAREKAEAELRERAEKESRERADAERAKRKARLAPDADRIRAVASSIQAIELPVFRDLESQKAIEGIADGIKRLVAYIESKADQLSK